MQIDVLLQPIEGNGYRATTVTPTHLVAEAATREQALNQLRTLVQKQLSEAELVTLQVPLRHEPNPLLAVAGILKDHPDLAEVEEYIRERRQQIDADPNWP